MDIWKYLPKSRNRKKAIARLKIHGEMVSTLYGQRDAADKESEERGRRIEELESIVKYEKMRGDAAAEVIEAVKEKELAHEEALAEILLGPASRYETRDGDRWLYKAIIRIAKGHRSNDLKNQELISEDNKTRFAHDVALIGGVASISRVPLMVYDNGDILYQTKTFDEMVNSYKLRDEIKENEVLMKNLNKGKKRVMKYGGGELHFVPEKLKHHDSVAIAYFVPGEEYFRLKDKDYDPKKQKKRAKTFAKFGENGAKAIYKTLKSHDRQGLELI